MILLGSVDYKTIIPCYIFHKKKSIEYGVTFSNMIFVILYST